MRRRLPAAARGTSACRRRGGWRGGARGRAAAFASWRAIVLSGGAERRREPVPPPQELLAGHSLRCRASWRVRQLLIDDPAEDVVARGADDHPAVDEEARRAGDADARDFVLRRLPRFFVFPRGEALVELVV